MVDVGGVMEEGEGGAEDDEDEADEYAEAKDVGDGELDVVNERGLGDGGFGGFCVFDGHCGES
jgi:hypothetical protein